MFLSYAYLHARLCPVPSNPILSTALVTSTSSSFAFCEQSRDVNRNCAVLCKFWYHTAFRDRTVNGVLSLPIKKNLHFRHVVIVDRWQIQSVAVRSTAAVRCSYQVSWYQQLQQRPSPKCVLQGHAEPLVARPCHAPVPTPKPTVAQSCRVVTRTVRPKRRRLLQHRWTDRGNVSVAVTTRGVFAVCTRFSNIFLSNVNSSVI
jgi:hypothetical protein